MKPLLYGLRYVLAHHILGSRTPLIGGLVLTNRCNLRCRHCRIPARGDSDLTLDETLEAARSFYRAGARSIYLEGGEPFLWRDRDFRLEDIVTRARAIGFLSVIVYTNGTVPIVTSANTVFVSLDGLEKTHDALRGPTFGKILGNVRASKHPSLYVNFTINRKNYRELEEFCAYVDGIPEIRGTFFYFHTPYYGYDDLYLDRPERAEVLRRLLVYRRRYRILNSRAGLLSALKDSWRRPLDICLVYERGTTYRCCRYPEDPELCRNCGYLSYAEIDQTLRLKPSAIASALRYF